MTRRILPLLLVLALAAFGRTHAQEAPRPTVSQLSRLIEEQKAMIEAQQAVIAEQQARLGAQDASIEDQKAKLAALEARLQEMAKRLDEIELLLPAAEQQKALEDRLARIEKSDKVPELPPNSCRPGTFPARCVSRAPTLLSSWEAASARPASSRCLPSAPTTVS